MEHFYTHPFLPEEEYVKRSKFRLPSPTVRVFDLVSISEKPLTFTDPFLFMTDDTEETARYSGLRQVLILGENDDNALRGSRKRT